MTISDSLKDLKNNIADIAKTGAENFNDKLKEVYSELSQQMHVLGDKIDDKEDKVAAALKDKYNNLKEAMTEYKDATKDNAAAMRERLVQQLEHLNKEIEIYHKNQKK